MISIIKQESIFEENLKKRLEFICEFCNNTSTTIVFCKRKIDKPNLKNCSKNNNNDRIIEKR